MRGGDLVIFYLQQINISYKIRSKPKTYLSRDLGSTSSRELYSKLGK